MTKNLSAAKKVQIALRNNLNNKIYKSLVKTFFKKALREINREDCSNHDEAFRSVSQAYSKIDKAVKKGIIPKNNGARKKSILANKLNDLSKKQIISSNN